MEKKETKLDSLWLEAAIVCGSFVLAFGTVANKYEDETRVPIQLGIFLIILGSFFFVNITNFFNKVFLLLNLIRLEINFSYLSN